ncbi:hypothetical protein V501_00797, partial [Pseudogymnoascus sp. VKM F-4519 (FW-2642)]
RLVGALIGKASLAALVRCFIRHTRAGRSPRHWIPAHVALCNATLPGDTDRSKKKVTSKSGSGKSRREHTLCYEDDGPHSELRIILDEEGNVVDMYMGDPEAGSWTREAVKSSNSDTVTVDPTTVTVTTGVAAGSESRPTFPASTIGLQTGSGS